MHSRFYGLIKRYRTVEYAYFQNVVESSYTFAFYSWSDWEKLIDWQALTGINLGLAYTGQEEIYRKTFSHFGVNDTAFVRCARRGMIVCVFRQCLAFATVQHTF